MSGGVFAVPFATSMFTGFAEMAFASAQLLPDVAATSSINVSLASSAISNLQTLQNNMENYSAAYADATSAISALNNHFANLTTIGYNAQKTSQILANQTALLKSGGLSGTAADRQQFFTDIQASGVTGFQGMVSERVADVAAIIKTNGGWPLPGASGTGELSGDGKGIWSGRVCMFRKESTHLCLTQARIPA